MKFNVEMDKKELEKFFNKTNNFKKVINSLNKVVIKISKSFKNSPFKNTIIVVSSMLVVFLISLCFKLSFNQGYEAAELDQHRHSNYMEDKQTSDYFEDQSTGNVLDWFIKSVLLLLGNNLSLLFFIIGVAWVIHGVGFRII